MTNPKGVVGMLRSVGVAAGTQKRTIQGLIENTVARKAKSCRSIRKRW